MRWRSTYGSLVTANFRPNVRNGEVAMHKRPAVGRGIFYTRDSGGEHETTPSEYVRWARDRAAALGVAFSCTPEQIDAMIRDRRSRDGDLFLDYCVKGHLLERPGLDALFDVALSDPAVTHVFI